MSPPCHTYNMVLCTEETHPTNIGAKLAQTGAGSAESHLEEQSSCVAVSACSKMSIVHFAYYLKQQSVSLYCQQEKWLAVLNGC